jgi:general secretion pathway protein A
MDNSVHVKSLGLKCHPFPVAPDDRHFYISSYFEQLIGEIVHGISARKGFMVVSGDVGVGKTTITRRILRILAGRGVRTSLVFHTSLKDVDLLREINRDFGLAPLSQNTGRHLGDYLQQLNAFLLSRFRAGKTCAIIIDDAQNLDRDSLELVRMISNLEADQQKLVQILLVGQTELMTRLGSHAMRQLRSRIVIRKVVRSLSCEEMRNYIRFKLSCAGDHGRISVTRPAFSRLYNRTKGNLRRLNLLMDRCLYAVCRRSDFRIGYAVVGLADADLNPGINRLRKRILVSISSVLLPLALAVGSWGLHLEVIRASTAAVAPVPKRFKIPQTPMVESTGTQNAAGGVTQKPNETPNHAFEEPAVKAFLRIHQLERYTADFQSALEDGRLGAIAQRIFGETGLRLVQLQLLPNSIRQRYGALAFTVGRNQQPVWLLFWRPQLELKRFQKNYRGSEIKTLQQRLAYMNLYQFEIDGIVGSRLIRAVAAFQKQSGLAVTGFPDDETLFWLCHQGSKEGVWPEG